MTQKTTDDTLPQWLLDYELLHKGTGREQIFQNLNRLSQEDIANRAKEMRRLLRTGSYSISRNDMNWQADPIPYLMTREDWQVLSNGIVQRMDLLQRIMCDLHGDQNLISQGLIAPRNMMGHPAYLPEVSRLPLPRMLLAGFDVAKQADGQFRLIKDHFQFPQGLGIQLENRIISRRVMGEEFAELGIERIVHFFKTIQRAFSTIHTENRSPRVVILSEGPDSPDYAEQSYLATFMDLILARSADLTVREGVVWIKSLEGLSRVDAIIRWIPDDLLDSLEQPKYSTIGVPGLLHAVRAGNVVLVNSPGTRMLQIPSVHQAIPDISRYWLNQDLILPQLAMTEHDSGQQGQTTQQVNAELRHYTKPDWHTVKTQIPMAEQDTSQEKLLYWQELAQYQQAPFWNVSKLQAEDFYFRCFAFWDGQQVHVMPACMCRTVSPIDEKSIGIKDTWVPSAGVQHDDQQSLDIPDAGEDIALIEGLIPSRAAENLFWLGTGLERCESLVRLLREYIDRFTDLAMYPDERNSWTLNTLKAGIYEKQLVYPYNQPGKVASDSLPNSHKQVLWHCMRGEQKQGDLLLAISLVLSSAAQVMELLSYDSLRIIDTLQTLQTSLQRLEKYTPLHQLQSLLDKIIAQVMAFNGSISDSLALNSGSFMLEMGSRIERSSQLCACIHTMLVDRPEDVKHTGALDAVLTAQVSAVTHRRRYRIRASVKTGLELLISDAHYPRSMAFQIEQLLALSEHLPNPERQGFYSTPTKLLLQLKMQCALADPQELTKKSEDGKREALESFLIITRELLGKFKERLQIRYFSHTQAANKLAWSTLAQPLEKPGDKSDDEKVDS